MSEDMLGTILVLAGGEELSLRAILTHLGKSDVGIEEGSFSVKVGRKLVKSGIVAIRKKKQRGVTENYYILTERGQSMVSRTRIEIQQRLTSLQQDLTQHLTVATKKEDYLGRLLGISSDAGWRKVGVCSRCGRQPREMTLREITLLLDDISQSIRLILKNQGGT